MATFLYFVAAIIATTGSLLWRKRLPQRRAIQYVAGDETGNASRIQDLKDLRDSHSTASLLAELVEKDGAGAWPPKANHDSWPMALRPYKDIYLELVPLLSAAEPSLDDEVNNSRRSEFRLVMRKLLTARINVTQVKEILESVEADNWTVVSRDAYNGFYCCIAVCRHAYRWATIPVVKVAQHETIIDFPHELDVPWPFLQRHFGVTADSGNNTSNVLHNFNERGERVYKINVGMSDLIRSSEEVFFRMFYNVEILAFPIYVELVHAIICFEKSDKAQCVAHLENINVKLRDLLLIFYENLTDSRISRSVWLSYVQGFQGWGVGRMIDGEFIKYDGLSGNHVLFFQALDAFLGMDRYLTDENMDRYIPVNQRNFCVALKEHSFRNKLEGVGNIEVEAEVTKIVNSLKVFRAAHRTRVMPYLKQPAPERLAMTAGKSVLEGANSKGIEEALEMLDQMMEMRLRETMC